MQLSYGGVEGRNGRSREVCAAATPAAASWKLEQTPQNCSVDWKGPACLEGRYSNSSLFTESWPDPGEVTHDDQPSSLLHHEQSYMHTYIRHEISCTGLSTQPCIPATLLTFRSVQPLLGYNLLGLQTSLFHSPIGACWSRIAQCWRHCSRQGSPEADGATKQASSCGITERPECLRRRNRHFCERSGRCKLETEEGRQKQR